MTYLWECGGYAADGILDDRIPDFVGVKHLRQGLSGKLGFLFANATPKPTTSEAKGMDFGVKAINYRFDAQSRAKHLDIRFGVKAINYRFDAYPRAKHLDRRFGVKP